MVEIMQTSLKDEAQSWWLRSDGIYERASVDPNAPSAHTYFMTNPSLSGRGSALQQRARPSPRLVTERGDS
jgi:polyphosphate kinase